MMGEHWRLAALCALFPELPWIAEPHDRSVSADVALRSICSACTVRNDCQTYVERAGVISGYWAGEDRTPPSELSGYGGAA